MHFCIITLCSHTKRKILPFVLLQFCLEHYSKQTISTRADDMFSSPCTMLLKLMLLLKYTSHSRRYFVRHLIATLHTTQSTTTIREKSIKLHSYREVTSKWQQEFVNGRSYLSSFQAECRDESRVRAGGTGPRDAPV